MTPAEWLAVAGLVKGFIEWLGKIRKTAARKGKWTAEEKAQIEAEWNALKNSPHWQTEEEEG
jgi:hypothetical protein